jgi:hypothetical protein
MRLAGFQPCYVPITGKPAQNADLCARWWSRENRLLLLLLLPAGYVQYGCPN